MHSVMHRGQIRQQFLGRQQSIHVAYHIAKYISIILHQIFHLNGVLFAENICALFSIRAQWALNDCKRKSHRCETYYILFAFKLIRKWQSRGIFPIFICVMRCSGPRHFDLHIHNNSYRCIGASTFTFQIKRGKKLEQIPIIHNKIAEELLHLFSFWINKMSKFSERRSIDSWPKIVNRRCQHELIFNMWSNACRIHANKCRWRTHRMQFSKQFQTMFEIPIFKSSRLYTQLNVKPQKLLNYRLHGICVSFMLRSIRRSTIQQSICVLRNTFASEWHGASLARPVKCSSFN